MESGNVEGKFFFLHSENPDSLVMLSNSETVLQHLLKQKLASFFIWIYSSLDQQTSQKIKCLCSQLKASFYISSSISEVSTLMQQSNNIYLFYVITESNMINEVTFLLRNQNCIEIVQYNKFKCLADMLDKSLMIQDHLQNKPTETTFFKIQQIQTQFGLKLFINEKRKALPEFRQLPNFVFPNDQNSQSNSLICCMAAMLHQNIDDEVRQKILDLLLGLKKQIYEEIDDENVFDLLKKNLLPPQKIIKIYSSNSTQFYKIINNFLRAFKHSTELYYIQPFFKKLFNSIKQLDASKTKRQSFCCFRGGFISEQQINRLMQSVGRFVQNLSFMSTSLHKQVGFLFMRNALFQINVEVGLNQEKFSYGFGDISQFSEFYSEREILFNPLNYFKVMQVKICRASENFEVYISMNFGQTIITQNGLSLKQQQEIDCMQYLQFKQKKNYKFKLLQGDSLNFSYEKEELNKSLYYWSKYCHVCYLSQQAIVMQQFRQQTNADKPQRLNNKILEITYYQGVEKIVRTLIKMGDEREALRLYRQTKNYFIHKAPQFAQQEQIQVLLNMIEFSLFMKKYHEALEIYHKCVSLLNPKIKQHQQLIESLLIDKFYIQALISLSSQNYMALKIEVQKVFKKHKSVQLSAMRALKAIVHVEFIYGRYQKSQKYYRELLVLNLRIYGGKSQLYVGLIGGLANCEFCKGDSLAAIKRYQDYIELIQQNMIGDNRGFFSALNNYARILFAAGNFEQSFNIFNKCLKFGWSILKWLKNSCTFIVIEVADVLFNIYLRFDLSLGLLKQCQSEIYSNYRCEQALYQRAIILRVKVQKALQEQKMNNKDLKSPRSWQQKYQLIHRVLKLGRRQLVKGKNNCKSFIDLS